MFRSPDVRSHVTLALGACGMAFALASVPTSTTTNIPRVVLPAWKPTTMFFVLNKDEWVLVDAPSTSIWDDVPANPLQAATEKREETKGSSKQTVTFPTDWHHCGSFFDDYPDEKLIRSSGSSENVVKLPATDVQ